MYLVCHRELDVLLPDIDYVEIPVDWWNAEADKSLLIGVFKHGVCPDWLAGTWPEPWYLRGDRAAAVLHSHTGLSSSPSSHTW